jgi:hypothetical protein
MALKEIKDLENRYMENVIVLMKKKITAEMYSPARS